MRDRSVHVRAPRILEAPVSLECRFLTRLRLPSDHPKVENNLVIGQVVGTHSVSAGLDYPAVGPEHVFLHEQGQIEFTSATDAEAIEAFHLLSATEGILPALESAHAIAEVVRRAPAMDPDQLILVNLSGRGDKDVESVLEYQAAAAARSGGGR